MSNADRSNANNMSNANSVSNANYADTNSLAPAAPQRPIARRCGFPECMKTAKPGGLCISHGGGKKCSVDGCTTSVVSRGFCVAHGGGKRCQREGCTKSAQTGGFCWIHGGGKKCGHDGCTKRAQSGGACISHGGGKRCRIDGCNKVVQYEGLCVGHGGYRKCLSMNCLKKALPNGYCHSHGGNTQCHFARCSKKAVQGGYCVDHRAQTNSPVPMRGTSSPAVLSRATSAEVQTISPLVPMGKQPRDWSRAVADAIVKLEPTTDQLASEGKRQLGLNAFRRSDANFPTPTDQHAPTSRHRLLPSVRRSFAAASSPIVGSSGSNSSSRDTSSRLWSRECSRCCVARCPRFAKVDAMCLLHRTASASRNPSPVGSAHHHFNSVRR